MAVGRSQRGRSWALTYLEHDILQAVVQPLLVLEPAVGPCHDAEPDHVIGDVLDNHLVTTAHRGAQLSDHVTPAQG